MSRHDAMERLSGDAAANGYHLAYRSPFDPGACHSVGLTPHGTTGWSGRPDHQALAPSYGSVIAAARVLLRELQGAGTDGPFRVVDWRNLRGPISDDGAGDAVDPTRESAAIDFFDWRKLRDSDDDADIMAQAVAMMDLTEWQAVAALRAQFDRDPAGTVEAFRELVTQIGALPFSEMVDALGADLCDKMRAHAEGVAADQILHRGRGGVSIAPALGFFLPRRVLRRRSST